MNGGNVEVGKLTEKESRIMEFKDIPKNQRLRFGVVGGCGGFIMPHHEIAINMPGTRRISAVALHQDSKVAIQAARKWPYRVKGYGSWQNMLDDQMSLAPNKRIDAVIIATPNFLHFEQALAFVNAGIPVVCEKPMTMTLDQAETLANAVNQLKVPFMLAHGYLGHNTARLMKFIIQSGLIGEVLKVVAEYDQGWLIQLLETQGVGLAEWRTNKKTAGPSGAGGDIGTHAFVQVLDATGLKVTSLEYARLETLIKGRGIDDDFTVLGRLSNGAPVDIRASQIRVGHKNNLRLEVNGTLGSVVWLQEEPEKLHVYRDGKAALTYFRGTISPNDDFLGDVPKEILQAFWPGGHNEGLHDAWRWLYDRFEEDVRYYWTGDFPFIVEGQGNAGISGFDYASVNEGVAEMEFIEAAVALACSSEAAPIQLSHCCSRKMYKPYA